jgi:hypothetical protein
MPKMITRKQLVQEAHDILNEMRAASRKASTRRGYSKLAGMTIPSKYDVQKAATEDLRLINTVCETLGFDHVWSDPEDKEVDLGSVD